MKNLRLSTILLFVFAIAGATLSFRATAQTEMKPPVALTQKIETTQIKSAAYE
jgi:hypothetical protein